MELSMYVCMYVVVEEFCCARYAMFINENTDMGCYQDVSTELLLEPVWYQKWMLIFYVNLSFFLGMI